MRLVGNVCAHKACEILGMFPKVGAGFGFGKALVNDFYTLLVGKLGVIFYDKILRCDYSAKALYRIVPFVDISGEGGASSSIVNPWEARNVFAIR